ncbi:FAD-dependent monooxygenase [Alsobacter sp. KACC 23698]|uniref:FAD-dependent monooxygenase n=1 Tax=Alsobacter sp. KACC 23698 TaxID=3149229 RepID=A0AAU7JDF0_9HYPH
MQDIVIVGAGPSGLALGAELHRLGRRPRILDRQAAGANTSRAAVVHARTLEVLEPLGVSAELLAEGVKVPVFRIRDRDAVLAEIGFAGIPSPYNFTLMCPQNVTEKHLLARLEALGGRVERPVEAAGIEAGGDGVRLRVRKGAGDEPVETRWLVGCDGGHSVVREQAGIAFEGAAYAQSFLLADVRMDWPLDREEVSLFFSPDGLVVVAPLPGGHFRIVATVDEAPHDPPQSLFEDLLRRRGPTSAGRITETVWTSRFRIQHKVARSPRQGRVLLCGDAAHVHSPAGGQGMNTGIQDAISLAGVLDRVLGGEPEALLDDWARRRHAVAEDVVATTDRLTRLATMKSGVGRSVRNALIGFFGKLPPLRSALARKLAELDGEERG